MNGKGRILSCVAIVLVGFGSDRARAEVEMTQLREPELAARIPNWKEAGILPGDVLIRNEYLHAVIMTGSPDPKNPRTTKCLLYSASGMEKNSPIVYEPGPGGSGWKAEAGQTPSVVVVRFRSQNSDWTADLSYTLRSESPWLEVSSVLRNTSLDQTLEIPVVDQLFAGAKAKADHENKIVFVTKATDGQALALAPLDQRMVVVDGPDCHFLGFQSGDPSSGSSSSLRNSLGLIRLGKSAPKTIVPVSGEKDWSRVLRDRKNWFRLAPGQERVVRRQFVLGANEDDAKTLASVVAPGNHTVARVTSPSAISKPKETTPQVESPSLSPSTATKPATPAKPTAKSTVKGLLRRNTDSNAKVTSTESTKKPSEKKSGRPTSSNYTLAPVPTDSRTKTPNPKLTPAPDIDVNKLELPPIKSKGSKETTAPTPESKLVLPGSSIETAAPAKSAVAGGKEPPAVRPAPAPLKPNKGAAAPTPAPTTPPTPSVILDITNLPAPKE